MTLPEIMKRRRYELRVTQEELADACKVSRQTIMSIEHGQSVPSWIIVKRIAKALDFSIDQIAV